MKFNIGDNVVIYDKYGLINYTVTSYKEPTEYQVAGLYKSLFECVKRNIISHRNINNIVSKYSSSDSVYYNVFTEVYNILSDGFTDLNVPGLF